MLNWTGRRKMKYCLLLLVLSIKILNARILKDYNGNSPDLLRVCYYCVGDSPPASKLNTTLCTHIIAGFAGIKNGLIHLGDEAKMKYFWETSQLKENNPNLKLLLTVGGGGKDKSFSDTFNSTWNRTRFIFSAFAALFSLNFDGLDVDWEFPVWNDNIAADKQNFASFLQEFKEFAMMYAKLVNRSPYLLSVAVAAPENIIKSSYNITEMAKYVDFINLMSYDFHDYFWYTPFTGLNSPLYKRSVEKSYFAQLNTAWAAEYWSQHGMPKSKIMVGIPTYAHSYTLVDSNVTGVDAPASGTNGDFTFSQACELLQNGGTRVFDNESQVPYAFLKNIWVSYEDQVSIYGKAKWIMAEGYGGSMTYDLNTDDWPCVCDKTPFVLHRIIHDVFTGVVT